MLKEFFLPLAKDMKAFAFDILFPKTCLLCGQGDELVCSECLSKLKLDASPRCPECGQPAMLGFTHPKCQQKWGLDGLFTIYDYHDSKVAKLLIQGKYYFLPEVYRILALSVARRLAKGYDDLLAEATLCPIPLHPRRLRWRGFNQAEILTNGLSQILNLPAENSLERTRSTKVQKDLPKEQRLKNLKNVFRAKKNNQIENRVWILIDDVVTTGTTLKEAAKILKRNGALKVYGLAVARD